MENRESNRKTSFFADWRSLHLLSCCFMLHVPSVCATFGSVFPKCKRSLLANQEVCPTVLLAKLNWFAMHMFFAYWHQGRWANKNLRFPRRVLPYFMVSLVIGAHPRCATSVLPFIWVHSESPRGMFLFGPDSILCSVGAIPLGMLWFVCFGAIPIELPIHGGNSCLAVHRNLQSHFGQVGRVQPISTAFSGDIPGHQQLQLDLFHPRRDPSKTRRWLQGILPSTNEHIILPWAMTCTGQRRPLQQAVLDFFSNKISYIQIICCRSSPCPSCMPPCLAIVIASKYLGLPIRSVHVGWALPPGYFSLLFQSGASHQCTCPAGLPLAPRVLS